MRTKTTFIGRETEISLLNSQLEKPSASLLVIDGRRRIGKSRSSEEFQRRSAVIDLQVYRQVKELQLKNNVKNLREDWRNTSPLRA